MPKLAIVFPHYGLNDVAKQNLRSFQDSNPNAEILLSSFEDEPANQSLSRVFERCRRDRNIAWRNADLLLYNAFLSCAKEFDKWFLAEWDAYCTTPILEFFKETWSFNAVAAAVVTPTRDPEWHWFKDLGRLPLRFRNVACGLKPITASLFGGETLKSMSEMFVAKPFDAFCELRLGTLASAAGAPPVPNPRSTYSVSWTRFPLDLREQTGIIHPVKYLVPDSCITPQRRWRVFTVLHQKTPLLRHFIRHYGNLGFTDIHLAVHADCGEIEWDELQALSTAKIHRERSFTGTYHCLKDTAIINGLKAAHIGDGEWSSAADIDEFYEFPDSLSEIERKAADANCLVGDFVDRFSASGELSRVDDEASIFQQFPNRANFTRDVLKQPTRKVMLMRGPHPYAEGHHRVYIPFDGSEVEYPQRGEVHHFKWHAGLSDYLATRLATEALHMQPRIKADLQRLRDFLAQAGSRLLPSVESGRANVA